MWARQQGVFDKKIEKNDIRAACLLEDESFCDKIWAWELGLFREISGKRAFY